MWTDQLVVSHASKIRHKSLLIEFWKTIDSKLVLGELELITITDNFFTSSVKLTPEVVHFIHRVYYAPEEERKVKASWQIEVNSSSKSLLCMDEGNYFSKLHFQRNGL